MPSKAIKLFCSTSPQTLVTEIRFYTGAEAELSASRGGGEGSASASAPRKATGQWQLVGDSERAEVHPGRGWRKQHKSHPQAGRRAWSQWSHLEGRSAALREQLEGDLGENQAAPAGGAGGAGAETEIGEQEAGGPGFRAPLLAGKGAAGRPPDSRQPSPRLPGHPALQPSCGTVPEHGEIRGPIESQS